MPPLLLAFALLLACAAHAEPVRVVRCFDGDTCRVLRAGAAASVPIRLAGIDAPELHARCPAEHAAAVAARDWLRALVYPPAVVSLRLESFDRKWRRDVGRLVADGQEVSSILVREGLARAYDGRGPRPGWC